MKARVWQCTIQPTSDFMGQRRSFQARNSPDVLCVAATGFCLIMKAFLTLLLCTFLASCAVTKLPDNLSRAMMNQENPDIVAEGVPSYLIMLDALILTYPENENLLLAGSRLYGAYAGAFTSDEQQAKKMADKALSYARRALCEYDKKACPLMDGPLDELNAALAERYDEGDISMLYAYGSAWAGWIQANSDDWNAIAQLGKVQSLMGWVASYDEAYDNATVQVYLGVLNTQVPPSFGGKPEVGREHFEKAIALTDGHHLMAKVLFAKQYARLMFEQDLHDQLLKDVLAAEPEYDGLTLINGLAQRQAQVLLDESPDYF